MEATKTETKTNAIAVQESAMHLANVEAINALQGTDDFKIYAKAVAENAYTNDIMQKRRAYAIFQLSKFEEQIKQNHYNGLGDLCDKLYGLDKTSVSQALAIGEHLNVNLVSDLAEYSENADGTKTLVFDWSFSQWIGLLASGKKGERTAAYIAGIIEEAKIEHDMSQQKIKAAIKALKARTVDGTANETEAETETETETETAIENDTEPKAYKITVFGASHAIVATFTAVFDNEEEAKKATYTAKGYTVEVKEA